MARALLPLLTAEKSEAALETSWMELLSSEVKPGPPELCKGFRAHTIYIVDFQASHVLGCSEFGCCQEVRVVDGEVLVVIFQNHQGCSLDAVK